MPNIIEQQDLLKGLPDARLASLMQSPNADMPPFLVAAEAQRRQAIRQQFAGSGSNESVVDSLTKQMANVPQNLKAPAQTPPQMPPPQQTGQESAGIGALGQPQQMAGGGPVRRFAAEGYVAPSPTMSDYIRTQFPLGSVPKTLSGIYGAVSDAWNSPTAEQIADQFRTTAGRTIDAATLNPYNSQFLGLDPASIRANREASNQANIQANNPMAGQGTTSTSSYNEAIRNMENLTRKTTEAEKAKPRDPTADQEDTSEENKKAPVEDSIRARLEALYATGEPSSWENAQKWFAMSAQFLDPNKTLMQSLAGAGSEYAGANAEQARAQRDDARAREEALLKYDIGTANSAKEDALAAQQHKEAILKGRTDVATGQLDDLYRQQRDLAERARRIDESIAKGEIMDPAAAQAEKQALTVASDRIGAKISTFEGFLGQAYGFPTIPTVDMAAGTIK